MGRDADSSDAELAGAAQLSELRQEIVGLRAEILALAKRAE